MTKKHFKVLAYALGELRERYGDKLPADAVVETIGNVCGSFNANFDRDRFAKACEPRPEDKR